MTINPPAISRFRITLIAMLALMSIWFVIGTIHWPLVGDATLVRYTVFLAHHGMTPYKDIVEINMPGSYAIDWAVQHIFGTSDLSWRLFSLSLIAIATATLILLALPYDWLAGLFAGVLLLLINGRDGIDQAGQRDLVMAVLLLLAYSCLFLSHRRSSPWLYLAFGLFASAACTIKPTVLPLAIALLLISIFLLNEDRLTRALYGTIGLLLPLIAVFIYLTRIHALVAFNSILNGLLPYHETIDRRPIAYLLGHVLSPVAALVVIWIPIALRQDWRNRERILIATGIVFGLLSWFIQAKAYAYHRYPFLALLLFLMAMDFTSAIRQRGWLQLIGATGLIAGCLVLAPLNLTKALAYDGRNQDFTYALESTLNRLDPATMSGHVQCMDMTSGCITTLNRMQLVQSTGYLYDWYLFAPNQTPVMHQQRERFFNAITTAPPRVFIVTNESGLNGPYSFSKLALWPQFTAFLQTRYTLAQEYTPTRAVKWWHPSRPPRSFRIYQLNPSTTQATGDPGK